MARVRKTHKDPAEHGIFIRCEVRSHTPKAYLIYTGKKTVWIGLFQIRKTFLTAEGHIRGITIPRWLAEEKGLI